MNTLYTIGHSSHSQDRLIELLQTHTVSAIADVRSSPFSKFVPQFNKGVLETILREADIEYVFLGRELGARRSEESCYVDDRVCYERAAQMPLFRTGLERLFQGMDQYEVALMCSEADPITCHRTILVSREVRRARPDTRILHILDDGDTETHEDAEERLVALHRLQPELFGDLASSVGLIDQAYALQAAKIAYRKGAEEE